MEPEHLLNQLEDWLREAQTHAAEPSIETSPRLRAVRELQARPRHPQALWLELLETLADLPGLPSGLRRAIADQLDSGARALRLEQGNPDPQRLALLLGLVENHLTRLAGDSLSEEEAAGWLGGAAEPSTGQPPTDADAGAPSTAIPDEKGAT